MSGLEEDLHGTAIEGLQWLLGAERFESVAMGEDGYPLRLSTIEPRAFALHKLWPSMRDDRDRIKKPRDASQAKAAIGISRQYFGKDIGPEQLDVFPEKVQRLAGQLGEEKRKRETPEPNW